MIEIRKVQTSDGHRIDLFLESSESRVIDAKHLMLFPALIDPHVHFRVPGGEHKETWETGAMAAIAGGVTTVFDMPNNTPSCITKERLADKRALVEQQLKRVDIPLRHYFYLGADRNHLKEIPRTEQEIVGLKIYMGSSTGDLLMNDREALEEAFRIAAESDVIVAVHAEDEELIQIRKKEFAGQTDPKYHSFIRSNLAAAKAVELAIHLAEKYGARLYVVHTSTREELDLIRRAKNKGLPVFAEAAPHHLFLDDEAYQEMGTKALVNPPLRSSKDTEALWEAIEDETIDTIGTDHAPHTLAEKMKPFGAAPSGFPSIELYFPLLLDAYHKKKLSLEQIVSLTHTRPQEIFRLPINDDVVLVDLEKVKTIDNEHLKTKAKWSPYAGWTLKGWPRYTIANGKLFDLEKL
ncbi:MAG: dihydroorotase [Verrucomicrobia bacterium]|nr:dihydroorotase [Verrucomicrobiota bacterium]